MAMTLLQRFGRTPLIVLGASLLLTAAATGITAWGERQRDLARFENAVQSAHDRIVSRLDIYLNALHGGAALFAVLDTVSQAQFRAYATGLDIHRRYPGIQGIGWTERLRSQGPGPATERHSIRYLEPLDVRNRRAMGYDMHTEPVRRAAMDHARDSGRASLSGKVTLLQEIAGQRPQAGFLLYLPVYRGGRTPATLEQRRALLRGFVYSPFRADDLFRGIFGSEQLPRVSFAVYDGTAADARALLHRSPRRNRGPSRYLAADTIQVAGRSWTVVYASEPVFEQGSGAPFTAAVFVAGLLVSAWLFWLALAQARARAAAEAAANAKGRFLATMSHELRTPLNAIGGYVDLMQLEIAGPITPLQAEYLERVLRAQKHLLGLINNVLNFAKLDAHRVQFAAEPVRLAGIIDEARGLVAPQAAARELEFKVRAGPDVTVIGDGEKIRQVLTNLLSNAIKFTEPGGRVTVEWERRGHAAFVHVADNGIGIPRERQQQVFDPFVQVDADLARTRQGTGLGLAIARELARGMHGDITLESTPGQGSTFTLHLPLHPRSPPSQAD